MKYLSNLLIGMAFMLTSSAHASAQGEKLLKQANQNAQQELARQIAAQDMPEQNKKLMAILQAAYDATDPGVEFIGKPDTDAHAAFRRAFDTAKEKCATATNFKNCNIYLRLANDKLGETKSVAAMAPTRTPQPPVKAKVPLFKRKK